MVGWRNTKRGIERGGGGRGGGWGEQGERVFGGRKSEGQRGTKCSYLPIVHLQ